MMNTYKIAFLLGFPEISGGTNVIMEHAVGLMKLGHQVSIVTELPFEKHRLSWHPEAMQLECLSHEQCRGIEFDIVIATWWRSVYDLPFVKGKRYAYFCQSIESRFFSEKEPDMKGLAEFTYRLPFPVVTEASWIAEYLRNHYGSNVTLVRNGIKKEIFTLEGPAVDTTRPNGLRVLVEGPLGVPFKKVEETIALVQQAGIQDIWLLTSTPNAEYPGVSRIFSKVPMVEVPSIYRSCDVLLKLSIVEGMFGPPLEMMHCGGTAITTDVTGHDEYMEHGYNGYVVQIGNDQEVVKALRTVANDPDLLLHLKENAKATAERWPSWEVSVKEMERFIADVVESEVDVRYMESQVMTMLIASLKLSGSLHSSINKTYSKEDLLYLLREGAKRYLKRKFPKLYEKIRTNKKKTIIEPKRKLSEYDGPFPIDVGLVKRAAYIGDGGLFSSFFPTRLGNAEILGFDKTDWDDETLKTICKQSPDVLFVFGMEFLEEARLSAVPGLKLIIGYEEQYNERDLELLKKISKREDCYIVHVSSKTTTWLQEQGVSMFGSIMLPVNVEHELHFQEWEARSNAFVAVGPRTSANTQYYNKIKDYLGHKLTWVEFISDRDREVPLCTKYMVYLPDQRNPYVQAIHVVRDLVCGCVVLSPKLKGDYAFMPGEHYLSYDNLAELERNILIARQFNDAFEIVRRVGYEKAKSYHLQYHRLISFK